MERIPNIVVFASGSGTNAENIISFGREAGNYEVGAVFCNRPGAGVLSRASALGVRTVLFSRDDMHTGRLADLLLREAPELIVLAGFLWLLPADIIGAYRNRILNIHPALLPKYGGKGMYGAHVHQAVIDAGETESGITVHYVNERYDEGSILFQAKCPVLPDDTPESLAARIHALEYEHYPRVIVERITKR